MEAIFLDCGAGGPQLKRNPLGGSSVKARILAALLFPLACGTGRHRDLSGSWLLCVADSTSRSECGTVQVGKVVSPTGFRYLAHYPLVFDLNLQSILRSARAPSSRCGSLLVDDDSSLTIQLGIECGALVEADGGGLNAEHLVFAGDTLAGAWYQSCFDGCPAHGRLTMKRPS